MPRIKYLIVCLFVVLTLVSKILPAHERVEASILTHASDPELPAPATGFTTQVANEFPFTRDAFMTMPEVPRLPNPSATGRSARLRIRVDDGATVTINSRETTTQKYDSYGSRLFTLTDLSSWQPTCVDILIQWKDGTSQQKSIFVEPGKSYREEFCAIPLLLTAATEGLTDPFADESASEATPDSVTEGPAEATPVELPPPAGV